jgi:urea carboxylase
VAVYSDADRLAKHVAMATEAIRLGPPPLPESYLNIDRVLDAAKAAGAQAVHPGYGLLSESAEFARRVEAAGLAFIGPTPEQLEQFGLKHTARELAAAAGVALVPGSGVVADAAEAVAAAEDIGFPVMVKASAGGGGIGMRRCGNRTEVAEAFEAVDRLATNNFGDASIFVERFVANARHIEVQVVGDGNGAVVHLGERDCSTQRRNQKVIEESPAPAIGEALRDRLCRSAADLAASVQYRSAGTVEFVVDADTLDRPDGGDAWFLEVNTRLQVEHGVTELVRGIDLVEWMVELAAGRRPDGFDRPPPPAGWAMEARIYAEDPAADFAPSSGLITEFSVPDDVRVDGWVEAGTDVSPFYDPLLAKVLVHGPTREAAIERLSDALADTTIAGITTNRTFLLDVLADGAFRSGDLSTRAFDSARPTAPELAIDDGGLFTTVQDLPGRVGYWDVGIPPSGPMDDLSHRLVNDLLGNEPGAAALEVTMVGPTLTFRHECSFALGGADFGATLDGVALPRWKVHHAPAGSKLSLGSTDGPGLRGVVAFAGGLDVPDHLGSGSTFVLGGFGGHGGRPLRPGDVVSLASPAIVADGAVEADDIPQLTDRWEVGVLAGPHAAPDYFTADDIETLYQTDWKVHFNSDRTGVRLVGPAPEWARPDGGEAGLHPSNIHDNAYAIGTIDFTGDMPIVLGRDGPSLGGFVCPATVANREFWKIGQARPGDTVRFVPIDHEGARSANPITSRLPQPQAPVLTNRPGDGDHPGITIRRDGDRNVLVEYGDNVLDLMLRLRVGALMDAVTEAELGGIAEMVPGIRSLQIGFDPETVAPDEVVEAVLELDRGLADIAGMQIPSRIVRLPLSWDDPATRLATEKYMQTVRPDAPWCPWNIEFIRRINGLDSVDEVKNIVFDASYLVLGLGDVYLGAPVATPVDPRHRLVTTKYNPARTWTAENSVGIGGSYLCIYGMEGPGGYQFVGRTVPVWDRWGRRRPTAEPERPWLLRFFDQIQWYEVGADELLELRADVESGRFEFDVTETTFSVADHLADLERNAQSIEAFTRRRNAAFDQERLRWAEAGIDVASTVIDDAVVADTSPVADGQHAVVAPVSGVVWRLDASVGDEIGEGESVATIEAMKMETSIPGSVGGVLTELRVEVGDVVQAGDIVAAIKPHGGGA